MTKLIYLILLLCCAHAGLAQGALAEAKFHEGSNLFINGNPTAALSAVNEGLRHAPSDDKLKTLKKILEEEKKKQEQQQQKEKEKREQKEQQEKQEQQQKDQKDKEKGKDKEQEKEKEGQKDEKDQQNKQDQEEQQDKQSKEEQEQKEQQEQAEKEKQAAEQKENKSKDLPQEVKDKLKEMKISEEKAHMILEAMKNQETQYLQQNKRKNTKRNDPSKPDW